MGVNKLVVNHDVLFDLTNDSVTPESLAEGFTAHDSSGSLIHGIMPEKSDGHTVTLVIRQQADSSLIPGYWAKVPIAISQIYLDGDMFFDESDWEPWIGYDLFAEFYYRIDLVCLGNNQPSFNILFLDENGSILESCLSIGVSCSKPEILSGLIHDKNGDTIEQMLVPRKMSFNTGYAKMFSEIEDIFTIPIEHGPYASEIEITYNGYNEESDISDANVYMYVDMSPLFKALEELGADFGDIEWQQIL